MVEFQNEPSLLLYDLFSQKQWQFQYLVTEILTGVTVERLLFSIMAHVFSSRPWIIDLEFRRIRKEINFGTVKG